MRRGRPSIATGSHKVARSFALLILLDHRNHGIRSDEAGDVIDMSVRVVAGMPLSSQITDCTPK